jgi:hypothetical protein
MMGRAPFTPGIDKAADFIRNEFASIGLEVFYSLDDYLQRFVVYRLQVQSRKVVLNGVEIPSERTFARVEAPSFRWTTGDPVEVIVIGPEEDVLQRIYSIDEMNHRNTLILMSTKHKAIFPKWADAWSRPFLSLDPPLSGPKMVCMLTDEVKVRSYEVEVTAPVEELQLTNVLGMIPGRRDDEIVLFGGHYDGIGILDPVDGDSIANSANDCASGTTVMIELARYFKARKKPERTLIFAAFTAHEIGFLGSNYLSRQLDSTDIVAMFSIAAIGKVDPQGPNRAHITGFDRSDFGVILQRAVDGTTYSFYPDPYVGLNLFVRSDNAPFARQGIPAHAIGTICMDPRDENIHRVSDEVETLDLINLTSMIRAIALGAIPIISGEATPSRIEPSLRPY